MSAIDSFDKRVRALFNQTRENPDKMIFALEMAIKRTEDSEDLAKALTDSYLGGGAGLGAYLVRMIDIELIQDAAITVTMEMANE